MRISEEMRMISKEGDVAYEWECLVDDIRSTAERGKTYLWYRLGNRRNARGIQSRLSSEGFVYQSQGENFTIRWGITSNTCEID